MRAKKSLGQHFLHSRIIAKKIAEASSVTKKDVVLEIGPGKGILTEQLLLKAKKVVAIEKDNRLIGVLRENFEEEIKNKKLEIISGDALSIDLKKLGFRPQKYKLVANIPYYITGKLFSHFLSHETHPSSITFLVQDEVARRIAKERKESILSLSIKIYGSPKYVQKVSKKYFSPQPKVDSAILTVENISKKSFSKEKKVDEKKYFEIVKLGFAQKRKTLLGNLSKKYKKEEVEKIFSTLNLDKKIRAEDVPTEHWKKIISSLEI